MQELSFDTFKSCKSQEITVPASLQMILPQDYVNYTKVSWVDSAGIKHLLYPTSKTSNPSPNYLQNSDGDFLLTAVGTVSSTSNTIVLDGEYKDIKVGMIINGPYIEPSTTVYVLSLSNSGGITTITMGYEFGSSFPQQVVPLDATEDNVGTTLTFRWNTDKAPRENINYIVENLSWNITDYKITGTASELSSIEVGMHVSHDNFPAGTTVTNVYDTTVVVSQLPDTAITSGGEITFWSEKDDSDTWANYKSASSSENQNQYDDDTYWPAEGSRFGLDPQHAQANGSFYIDCHSGKIHFSSNISGKTVILDYISDGLGTDAEMQVHKFAEEAMYKWIAHAILATRANVPEHQVMRFKKERFAEIRKAKLRLSNIKLEEITQILRGKSKQIKH
jgi:hypothetical protein